MHPIIYPLLLQICLVFPSLLLLFFSRIWAVKKGQVEARKFKLNLPETMPEHLIRYSKHFSNLFEMPVIFYVLCLMCLHFNYHSQSLVFLAWLFVSSRLVHSYVFLGKNKIIPRLLAFAVGPLSLLIMFIIIALQILNL